ncbi:hypothetical protein GCM10010358_73370 [Streptomyces minutiscleroticus]|uniref:Uncharacterized protein n=2 Tax=Streptomyces minutiscleroticus TaxID=68238 RepID=A0A918P0I3_9ACTN|nr:hypothetical protein GCM10010358_73370 [Streptomyces minutiscleroticus]
MHDERRLRDLEAEAFRTGRTLAEYGQALAQIREQQRTAFSTIDSLADAVGAPRRAVHRPALGRHRARSVRPRPQPGHRPRQPVLMPGRPLRQ